MKTYYIKTLKKISLVLIPSIILSTTATAHDPKLDEGKAGISKQEHQSINRDNAAEEAVNMFHYALKNKDKKKAKALLDENVVIFEGGGVERSANEYASHHMIADMEYVSAINTETLETDIKVIGDIAYSMSRTKSTGKFKGKDINHESMETIILRKIEGNWKISHIHWSN